MYLLYIDASGTPEPQDSSTHFVVVGLCIHERFWHQAERAVRDLKDPFRVEDEDFELHAKELCSWIREQDEVPDLGDRDFVARRRAVLAVQGQRLRDRPTRRRTERYRHSLPYVHLTREERGRIYEDALDLVGASGWKLFGEAIDKQYFFSRKPGASIVHQGWAQVVSRFDYFLDRQRRPRRQAGMLIVDREPTREKTIRDLIGTFRVSGHPWGQVKHVIEAPFFVDSEGAPAIQLADLCCHAVRRYLEKRGQHEERNFRRIFDRFDRGWRGRLHGLRHFCSPKSCDCAVCSARGHGRLAESTA